MWRFAVLKSFRHHFLPSKTKEVLPKPFLYNSHDSNTCPRVRHLASDSALPKEAQVVICGGGVVGCSVAYHLAKLGWKDVLLLEQGTLNCGTTWHAAGLVGKLRSTSIESKLLSYSVELYSSLEEETGLGTGFKRCGGLALAQTEERLTFLKKRQSIARTLNVDCEILSRKEIQNLIPLEMKLDDVLGGLWIPSEGVATSSDVCQSLARGATLNGVKIFEKVVVESIITDGKSITGVKTSNGTVKCEILVNCAGQWAWEFGQKCAPKVNFPLHSTEHYYIVTKPIEGVTSMLPVIRDHDSQIYIREWSGGLMAGGFELNALPVFHEGIPKGFEYQLLPENWDHFSELMDNMLHRLPFMEKAEIRQMINGPESFTPDGRYLLGEVPEVRNFYVAAGFNSSGIAGAGGAGMALAGWITEGEPTMDLSGVDIRRFAPHHNNKRFLRECVKETLAWHYLLRYPYSERKAARGLRCSPLFPELSAAGASWSEKMGWEVPKWFALPGEDHPSENGFGKPGWLSCTEVEYKSCTEGVAVVDLTALGLFEIESSTNGEVEHFLQLLCSNDVAIPVGCSVRTLILNKRGGIELSCTVIREAQNRFIIMLDDAERVTAAHSMISHNIPSNSAISLRNIQSRYAILGVLGPNSTQLLQTLTQTPLKENLFPANIVKEIDLGFASGVKTFKTNYFGDQKNDWKLLVPTEFAVSLYREMMEAGRDLGIRNAGHSVLDGLRIERLIPQMGKEMTSFVTPREAGVMDRVQLDKNCDFLGKQALLADDQQPAKKHLVQIALEERDDTNYPWGGEPILRNGSSVGSTISASHSFKLDRPMCLGYLEGEGLDATVEDGGFEIDVAGALYPVSVQIFNRDLKDKFVETS